jgi:hypothetical protein
MSSLDKDSFMQCPRHGTQRPTFICRHLQYGQALGFFTPDEPLTKENPWKNAWCGACEEVLAKEGCWNDRSEGFAGVMVICEGCYEEIRLRNDTQQRR